MDQLDGIGYCAHEIRPELVTNENGMDGIKFTVIGHKTGTAEADEVLFSFITGVPGSAVLASAILDEADKADDVTKMIASMALARFEMEKSPVQTPADDPMGALVAALFGAISEGEPTGGTEGEKPRGVKAVSPADEPVRLLYGTGNPGGRPTIAPVDNRDEYPGLGEGGYL